LKIDLRLRAQTLRGFLQEEIMHNFSYYVPTEIVFGAGSVEKTAEMVKKHGAGRVLVVYGGGSAKKSGLIDRLSAQFRDAGLAFETLGGVHPNPRLGFAREGVKLAQSFRADLILAVGGGSVIDTCKAIAHGAANPGTDIWDFWKKRRTLTRSMPVGVVLTIPAAGSETSDSAVLTDEVVGEKRGLNTDLNRPVFAIMDPALAATLPRRQAACGVTDIMMHTMERYFSPVTGNEMTDAIAEALLRNVIRFGPAAAENPADPEAMSEIMWAGSLSHNGLTGLGGQKDFATHQLGHAISEKFDSIHGESLSAVWGSWARYVMGTNPERFARFAQNVWGIEPEAEAGIAATEKFFASLGMPLCLSELGVGVQDEDGLADLALRCSYQKTREIGSFRRLGYDDILEIYRAANH
jgi:alcohol dehydrogenase YqhD (iron-dependent ADH family)